MKARFKGPFFTGGLCCLHTLQNIPLKKQNLLILTKNKFYYKYDLANAIHTMLGEVEPILELWHFEPVRVPS